jgi:hypothetical protein
LPVLTRDEYSDETLANAGGLQLCRNKQVSVDNHIVDENEMFNISNWINDLFILSKGSTSGNHNSTAV